MFVTRPHITLAEKGAHLFAYKSAIQKERDDTTVPPNCLMWGLGFRVRVYKGLGLRV